MKHPEIAKRMTTALNDAGMRAKELSDRSGISKASISQYVNGSHAPSNIAAGKLAAVLGVSPAWLMGFDVPQNASESPGTMQTVKHTLTDTESEIIRKYRALGASDRARIEERMDEMLEKKTQRMEDNLDVG